MSKKPPAKKNAKEEIKGLDPNEYIRKVIIIIFFNCYYYLFLLILLNNYIDNRKLNYHH